MKLKSLLTALLVMLTTFAVAQVEDGKVYRIVSAKYGTVMSESPIMHTLSCASKGADTDYHEMWQFNATDDGKYTIKNVYTQRYIQYEDGKNVVWRTGTELTKFSVAETPGLKGCYNIDSSAGHNWGMHCDGSSNIVPWTYGTSEISGTEWGFELVDISDEEIAAATASYQDYAKVLDNANDIAAKVQALFDDNACTAMKAEWAAKSDAEVVAALEGVPADLQQAVLKIKNNAWDEVIREKEFRVYDYKPYSDPAVWADRLFTRPYNRINNPTGISTSDSKSFIYVFVENIPEGTTIDLAEMASTKFWGVDTPLHEGLNVVPCSNKDGSLFIRYVCETAIDGKKLADYPRVKIHIEGGYVNGFWSKERGHTNEDWKYMQEHMFTNETALQAVGDYTVLNFRTKEFLSTHADNGYEYNDDGTPVEGCPENIEGVMRLWDFWNERQNHYMALDKYYEWTNNKQLAMSDDNGFMDASAYRTHYNNNTLTTIVNYKRLIQDAGSSWGPNHEIGHTNQYAFEIVGTSEVSNNALTNFAIFDQGTHVSRGNNMQNQILDFENKIPYVVRGEGSYGSKLFSMTRMYFQLFLYFHAAEKDTTFYPRLFEKLRYDRLPGWATGSLDELDENGFYKNSVDASKDQLKFAEACCEIAQMDLSEFFEAWGFFVPMKNDFVGDYGHHWVYLLEEDAKASKARMQQYEKKGGHLMFLEDRVRKSKQKKSPFSDGTGYRKNYADWEGERIGEVGKFGQWMDYIDESVKAQGYYYAVSTSKVLIKEAEGAGGALGFKLYNAETGELLTYTNGYEMKLPKAAVGVPLKVVAAQADGTDSEVPHASEGPESMQKDALNASLKKVNNNIIMQKADAETAVGYYRPEAIADLEALYNEANRVFKGTAESEYSYAELSMMLDDEYNKVIADVNSRILLKEGTEFTMRRAAGSYVGYYVVGTTASTVGIDKEIGGDSKANWAVEYAGTPGEYYLKCVSNGKYLTVISNTGAGLGSKQPGDVKVTIEYTTDGNLNFVLVDDVERAFGLGDDGNVKALPINERGAKWKVDIVSDNSDKLYAEMLEELLTEANVKIAEVLNLDSLQTMNIFNDYIVVKDNNLNTYALNLLYTYYEVNANKETADVMQKKEYVELLRKQLAAIEGKYILSAPITTKGERVVWCYLISNVSDKLLVVNKNGRLALADDVTDDALWSLVATGRPNEYKVYNAGKQGFVYKDGNYLKAPMSAGADYAPISIVYNSENNGLLLTVDGKVMYENNNGGMQLSGTQKSYWRVQTALIEDNKELADIITIIESVLPEATANGAIYDLNGRRVENPTRGIFIQNGKKVLVK